MSWPSAPTQGDALCWGSAVGRRGALIGLDARHVKEPADKPLLAVEVVRVLR